MPLPKTNNVAARATEVYSHLIQHVLKLQASKALCRDPNELELLQSHLPYLRQLLTCCACGGILRHALVSPGCDHHYCSSCQSCAPLWRITCRQCRERVDLAPSHKMQTLVDCYRCMCHLVGTFYSSTAPDCQEQNSEESFDPVAALVSEVKTGSKCSLQIFKIKPPKDFLLKETPPTVAPVPLSNVEPPAEPVLQETVKAQTTFGSQDSPTCEST